MLPLDANFLEYFDIKQDSKGIERMFYGAISVGEFEGSVQANLADNSMMIKRNVDANMVNYRTCKILKQSAFSIVVGLNYTNVRTTFLNFLKKMFKI